MKINPSTKTTIAGVLSLVWVVSALIGYAYAHKPFTAEELLGALTALWRTTIAISILSVAGGIGMLSPVKNWNVPPFTTMMLTAGLGIGAISIFILAIASLIGFRRPLWIYLIIMTVLLWKPILAWWKNWGRPDSFLRESSRMGILVSIPAFIILACQYLKALAPPFQFDALTYHLALPRFYLLSGGLAYTAENVFWGMPQLIEMLYMLAMSLGGPEAAVTLGWWIGLVTLFGLADFINHTHGTSSAWVGIACLLAGAGITTSLSSGYIEWASILYGATTMVSLYRWLAHKDDSALIAAGIFTGLAISVKYTNGLAYIGGAAVILFLRKTDAFIGLFKKLAAFSGIAALTLSPWLIKNALATHNPFYPLFFPSGGMDAILLDFYQFEPHQKDWSRLLLLPFQATLMGVDSREGYSSSIGALFLGLSPLAWVGWREQSPGQKLIGKIGAVILLTGFAVWAIGSQFRGLLIQTRLYFILFPAWAALAAAGYANISTLKSGSIRLGNIMSAMVLLSLSFNAFSTLAENAVSNPSLVIFNPEGSERYLRRHLGDYPAVMQEVNVLPTGARAIMLWETRSLFCIPKCDPDELIGRWYNDWTIHRDPEQIMLSWKRRGYTHVLVNQAGADFVRQFDGNAPPAEYWEGLEATLNLLTPMETTAGNYRLYQLP